MILLLLELVIVLVVVHKSIFFPNFDFGQKLATHPVSEAGLVDEEVAEDGQVLPDELLDGVAVSGVLGLEGAREGADGLVVVVVADEERVVGRLAQVHEEADAGEGLVARSGLAQRHLEREEGTLRFRSSCYNG